jgi:hypothetical protein
VNWKFPAASEVTAPYAPPPTAASRAATPERSSVALPTTVGLELVTSPGVGPVTATAGDTMSIRTTRSRCASSLPARSTLQ